MHELAIARNIVAIVAEHAGGRRVGKVTLDIGKLSGVMAGAIAFCFDQVAAGTLLDEAALEIREIEARARCQSCGAEFAQSALYTACPCGSRQFTRLQGEELKIRTMELREETERCAEPAVALTKAG
jgi:hydrogenase nickel incorporation protein HypA/HybF